MSNPCLGSEVERERGLKAEEDEVRRECRGRGVAEEGRREEGKGRIKLEIIFRQKQR